MLNTKVSRPAPMIIAVCFQVFALTCLLSPLAFKFHFSCLDSHVCMFSLISISFLVLAVATLIDSEAQFELRLKELGITEEVVTLVKNHGVRTLSQLSFAVGSPGQPLQDANCQAFLQAATGRAPTIKEVAATKRAAFEAQTWLVATLRQNVDRNEDVPRKVPTAERATRMQALKNRLGGLSVTGEHDPAHSLLDRACTMFDSNSLKYMDPASCISRAKEIQGTVKDRELTLEKGSLVLKSNEDKLSSPTDSEIKVHYAFIRRSIALEFAKIMSFEQHALWEEFLFQSLHREPPPGYSKPTLSQIVQCDKTAFTRVAETLDSIRRRDDGTYPAGEALLALRSDPLVTLHLAPIARAASSPGSQVSNFRQRAQPYPSQSPGKSSGKGKGKKGGKSSPMPAALIGKWSKTGTGEPLCFGYNCASGCPETASRGIKDGERCSRGWHLCCEPRCLQAHSLQAHNKKAGA